MTAKAQREQSLRARAQPRDERGRFDTWGKNHPGRAAPATPPVRRKTVNSMPPAAVSARMQNSGGGVTCMEEMPLFEAGGPTGRLQVVTVGKTVCRIPVDEDGFVPFEYLKQRYFETKKANGRHRKPNIDSSKNAKIVFTGKRFRPEEIAKWVANPNRYDIEGIDTEGTSGTIFLLGSKKRRDGITVENAFGDQEGRIMNHLEKNFTSAELAALSSEKKYLIYVSKPDTDATGIYVPGTNTAYVDPGYLECPETTVHETTHALRYNDKRRKGTVTSTRIPRYGRISDQERTLEEAATEGETITRLTPFEYQDTSYYSDVSKDPAAALVADRITFAGKKERGLKGNAAVSAVEKNFSASNISGLKLGNAPMSAKEYAEYLKKSQPKRPEKSTK